MKAALDGSQSGGGRLSRLVLGGAFSALSVLTRPSGLYVIALWVGLIVLLGLRNRRISPALGDAALLVLVASIPIGLWVYRNDRVFSLPKLTFVDKNNLVYYAGAGAYEIERGVSFEEAQALISREFRIVPVEVVQNDFAYRTTVREIDRELNAVWPSVFFRYPRALLLSSIGGLAKATVSHNVAELADMTSQRWEPPGLGAILRFDPVSMARLVRNGPLLSTVFVWQVLHSLAALSLALPGLIIVLGTPRLRSAGLVILVMLAYSYMTVCLFGVEAYCRCRVPALPFLYMFAGVGLDRIRHLLTHAAERILDTAPITGSAA